MNRHLTEQELIEFEFKLDSDVRRAEISSHLQECASCRAHLERLNSKFSALELLREEIKASDDLITNVVEQAAQPVGPRIVPFNKPAWLSTAAAVILVGSILLISNLREDSKTLHEIVKEPEGKSSRAEGEVLKEKGMDSELGMVAKKPDERGRVQPLSEPAPTKPATKIYAPAMWKYKCPRTRSQEANWHFLSFSR